MYTFNLIAIRQHSMNFFTLVILTVVHVVAIIVTGFRVYYRVVTRRFWWDDFVAFFALLGDCAYISALWFGYASPSECY